MDRFFHRNPKLCEHICLAVVTLVASYSLVQLALGEISFLSCSVIMGSPITDKTKKVAKKLRSFDSLALARSRDQSKRNTAEIHKSLLDDEIECNRLKLLVAI